MAEEDPQNFSSEKTLKVHDFIKYDIQGLAPDGKTTMNYQIVANEGFLYLHEPKLVQDNGNQMERNYVNKTPFYVIPASIPEKTRDCYTQHVDKNDKACSTKCSLHQIDSYILFRKESQCNGSTNTKIQRTLSKVIMTDERRPILPAKRNKKKKKNNPKVFTASAIAPQVAVNTTTSVAYMDSDNSDRLYYLLQNLINARQKEIQQHHWNCYISELRNKYNALENDQSGFALHNQNKGNLYTSPKPYVSEERLFPVQLKPSNHGLEVEQHFVNDINFTNRPFIVREQKQDKNKNNYYCYPTSSQGQFMLLRKEKKIQQNVMGECLYKNNLYNAIHVVPEEKSNRTPLAPTDDERLFNRETYDNCRSNKLAYSCCGLESAEIYSNLELSCGKSKLKDPSQNNTNTCTKNCMGPCATPLKVKTNTCTQTIHIQTPCNCSRADDTAVKVMFPTSTACQCDNMETISDPNMKTKKYVNKFTNSSKLHNRYWNINNACHQCMEEAICGHGSNNSVTKKSDLKIKAIELKLDKLIKSINTLILDAKPNQCIKVKSQKSIAINYSTTNTRIDRGYNTTNIRTNHDYSTTDKGIKRNFSTTTNIIDADCTSSNYGMNKDYPSFNDAKQLVNNFVQMETLSTHMPRNTESNVDIFLEEINKSNKAKRDIEDIINGYSVKRNIIVDAPTKECSTEVTASLSKQQIRNIFSKPVASEEKQSTTAVNTEPLGLVALMQVSTETIKQLLSYVPAINGRFVVPSMSRGCKHYDPRYICSICGAEFEKSSELSRHIQNHDLGKAKDCCVCRHVLDSSNTQVSGVFSCQYCGLKFARAYCCELHQETCAKRFGKRHEVSSSLMLLR